MASSPIPSSQIDGETMETGTEFILGAPKSLKMVTVAMKLKDTLSLENKTKADSQIENRLVIAKREKREGMEVWD